MRARRAFLGAAVLAATLGWPGCGGGGSSTTSTSSASTSSGMGGASSTTSTSSASTSSGMGGMSTGSTTTSISSSSSGSPAFASCQGHIYACGDTIDNDMDGLIDSQDPDCLGPCDNTEDNYYGALPGQNQAPCKSDCYFDQDIDAGNDGCFWNHACDPHELSPAWYPETESGATCSYNPNVVTPGTNETCAQLYNMQSNLCISYCGPLTPNGCDCFGCCELPAGSGSYVWLGSLDSNSQPSCSIATVADTTKCHPCLPVAACHKDCEHCEICIGKTMLPPDCTPDGGGANQCGPGVQTCGPPGQAPCPADYYCITGCCQHVPL
jgi:hypothetical protein